MEVEKSSPDLTLRFFGNWNETEKVGLPDSFDIICDQFLKTDVVFRSVPRTGIKLTLQNFRRLDIA